MPIVFQGHFHEKKPFVIGFPGYLLSPQEDRKMQHKIYFTTPSLWNKIKCFTILFINTIEEFLIQEVFRPNLFIILRPVLEQIKIISFIVDLKYKQVLSKTRYLFWMNQINYIYQPHLVG